MKIPFLDLKRLHRPLEASLEAACQRVREKGWFVLGEELRSFEAAFAAYCGVEHGIGVGSGLDALYLALKALDVGPGDEVLIPAYTFVATALAVSATGARPVLVDVEAHRPTLDPDALPAVLTPRTRGIVVVHLHGHLAPMDRIAAFARRQGLFVVEDAAQAHGGRFHGRPAGALSQAGCFSFYPGKNLGALGDGGMVVTQDARLAERIRMLRNYGSEQKYRHVVAGINSRLDELQAAFLQVKLPHLDRWNRARRQVAASYARLIENPAVTLPVTSPDSESAWHLYVLRTPYRDHLMEHLERSGIQAQIHYPHAIHQVEAYAERFTGQRFENAEAWVAHCLSLPMAPYLNEDEVAWIAEVVNRWVPPRT